MENDIKASIYGSIISADNTDYTEEQKQESMRRYELCGSDKDWEFILKPFEKPNGKNKLIDLFK